MPSDLASMLSFSSCFMAQLTALHNGGKLASYSKETYHFGPARQVLGDRPLSFHPPTIFGLPVGGSLAWNVGPRSPTFQQKTSAEDTPIRIGIVGGGIAGVSVARALMKRLPASEENETQYTITIFEGDSNGDARHHQHDNNHRPRWIAATARNAK